jgi:hypothetical protein
MAVPLVTVFISPLWNLILEVRGQIVRSHAHNVGRSVCGHLTKERDGRWLKLFEACEHSIVLSRAEFDCILFTLYP